MVVEYTEHALFRMRHRRILRTNIEEAIKDPDFSFTIRAGRLAAVKKFGDKFLKVVYERSNNKITVVTVYWTRRIRR